MVVAVFYSGELHFGYRGGDHRGAGTAEPLRHLSCDTLSTCGVLLWACVHAGGLHATLAGVILAALIPMCPPDYRTLTLQADAILAAEAQHSGEHYPVGPSIQALEALDAIHDRLEPPGRPRLLRNTVPRSSYVVFPIFTLANAGVAVSTDVFNHHSLLVLVIMTGLTDDTIDPGDSPQSCCSAASMCWQRG